MTTVGPGVAEIRLRAASGAYRVLYIARFGDAAFVLHCFQKKTQATSKRDVQIAARRLRELEKDDER